MSLLAWSLHNFLARGKGPAWPCTGYSPDQSQESLSQELRQGAWGLGLSRPLRAYLQNAGRLAAGLCRKSAVRLDQTSPRLWPLLDVTQNNFPSCTLAGGSWGSKPRLRWKSGTVNGIPLLICWPQRVWGVTVPDDFEDNLLSWGRKGSPLRTQCVSSRRPFMLSGIAKQVSFYNPHRK